MRAAVITICVALLLEGWSATAAVGPHASRYTVDSLCASMPLASSAVGVFAVRMDGDTIACVNPRLRLIPASNVKLFTTGLSLLELGEDYRFETTIAYDGSIEDGVLHGDLYIVGGGDPTTGARVPCAEPSRNLFSEWAEMVRDAGITRIEGLVVGDARIFSDPMHENLGWTYDDLGTYYGAGPSGLNFFENAQDFTVVPAGKAGDPPVFRESYPRTPWMEYVNMATTGPARSANSVYYINTPLAPVGSFAGSFPVDRRSYLLECSNRFGAYTCAWYFRNYLTESGIESEGAADITHDGMLRTVPGGDGLRPAAGSARLLALGSTFSPGLVPIVRETNCESDNFFAETLLRAMALARTGSVSHDACIDAIGAAMSDLGLETDGVCQIFDGSGLSRKNYVSTGFFVNFLVRMFNSPCRQTYLSCLPSPGERGTLEYKFPSEPEGLRKRIRMKSGSMNGVRSYSGYILPSDADPSHTIVFSLIVNNAVSPSWVLSPVIDSIILSLASEN